MYEKLFQNGPVISSTKPFLSRIYKNKTEQKIFYNLRKEGFNIVLSSSIKLSVGFQI